jgi:uncharacterized protein YegP (UPF0339 family)
MIKIKIEQSRDGQFFFTVRTKNGRVRTTSETYTRKRDAKRAAEQHRYEMAMLHVRIEEV